MTTDALDADVSYAVYRAGQARTYALRCGSDVDAVVIDGELCGAPEGGTVSEAHTGVLARVELWTQRGVARRIKLHFAGGKIVAGGSEEGAHRAFDLAPDQDFWVCWTATRCLGVWPVGPPATAAPPFVVFAAPAPATATGGAVATGPALEQHAFTTLRQARAKLQSLRATGGGGLLLRADGVELGLTDTDGSTELRQTPEVRQFRFAAAAALVSRWGTPKATEQQASQQGGDAAATAADGDGDGAAAAAPAPARTTTAGATVGAAAGADTARTGFDPEAFLLIGQSADAGGFFAEYFESRGRALEAALRDSGAPMPCALMHRGAFLDCESMPTATIPQALKDYERDRLRRVEYLWGSTSKAPPHFAAHVVSGSGGNVREAVRRQFRAVAARLDAAFAGREELVRCCLLGAFTGHNVLLAGPPGTGKSMVARAVLRGAVVDGAREAALKEEEAKKKKQQEAEQRAQAPPSDPATPATQAAETARGDTTQAASDGGGGRRRTAAEHFELTFHGGTTPEEVFGSIMFDKLKLGVLKHNVACMLPDARTALLDEIFKAQPAVLSSMLTILNERQFVNYNDVEGRLWFAIGASNETPTAEYMQAILDRMHVRCFVDYVPPRQAAGLSTTRFAAGDFDPALRMSVDTLEALQQASATRDPCGEGFCVRLTPAAAAVRDTLDRAATYLAPGSGASAGHEMETYGGEVVSDRRRVDMGRMLRAVAFSCGRERVEPLDCFFMCYYGWRTRQQFTTMRVLAMRTIARHYYHATVDADAAPASAGPGTIDDLRKRLETDLNGHMWLAGTPMAAELLRFFDGHATLPRACDFVDVQVARIGDVDAHTGGPMRLGPNPYQGLFAWTRHRATWKDKCVSIEFEAPSERGPARWLARVGPLGRADYHTKALHDAIEADDAVTVRAIMERRPKIAPLVPYRWSPLYNALRNCAPAAYRCIAEHPFAPVLRHMHMSSTCAIHAWYLSKCGRGSDMFFAAMAMDGPYALADVSSYGDSRGWRRVGHNKAKDNRCHPFWKDVPEGQPCPGDQDIEELLERVAGLRAEMPDIVRAIHDGDVAEVEAILHGFCTTHFHVCHLEYSYQGEVLTPSAIAERARSNEGGDSGDGSGAELQRRRDAIVKLLADHGAVSAAPHERRATQGGLVHGNVYTIHARHYPKGVVDVRYGKDEDGTTCWLFNLNGWNAQWWEAIELPNGKWSFRSQVGTKSRLLCSNGSGQRGDIHIRRVDPSDPCAAFVVTPTDDGFCTIATAEGRFLDVAENNTHEADLLSWPPHGEPNQQFCFRPVDTS